MRAQDLLTRSTPQEVTDERPSAGYVQPAWADAAIIFESGELLWGIGFGAEGCATGELCFNTALTGYEEVLTDPSYAEQIITFTTPHIGNVGVNPADTEHRRPACRGLVVRERPTSASSYRATADLEPWLIDHGLVGISGIDTRALTMRLREGAPKASVAFDRGAPLDIPKILEKTQKWCGLQDAELTLSVAEEKLGEWGEGLWTPPEGGAPDPSSTSLRPTPIQSAHSGRPDHPGRPRVLVIDFGVKDHILRCLHDRGCAVHVVSPRSSLKDLLALDPHGVCLSNGPGDPGATLRYARPLIEGLLSCDTLPIFGICLGHQLLALTLGARTEKMTRGHRGTNHPILNLETQRVEITSQNHGFVVTDLPKGVIETHRSLFDGTLAGLRLEGRPVFSVQYHPESSPGPHDSRYLFNMFAEEVFTSWTQATSSSAQMKSIGAQERALPFDLSLEKRRRKILIVGAGPIVIGQACEFDYSGAQACKALRQAGHEVVLVNSNPATIMTDPQLADRTYIEPLTPDYLEEIIRIERPDTLLPTMGGQTALNLCLELQSQGILERYNIEMVGARAEAIETAENRHLFRVAMDEIGLSSPRSRVVGTIEEALDALEDTGLPAIIRPSFTLGGSGGGIAKTRAELIEIVTLGLKLSPITQVLIEESLLGWKEFELEVVRDGADNGVIICSIENIDPMGIHTGDSITVAPALTLTDKEYQRLRDGALACLRRVGVDTGGSNVQFAINPKDGRAVVIEMNPRVSRSSALASKATGFPIAKVAALLAVGHRLNDLDNEITRTTPASFEPSIDYVVVKIPRFTFEKFSDEVPLLNTSMKSVGEVMSIGRSFEAAFQKALRGLEVGLTGLDPQALPETHPEILDQLEERRPMRLLLAAEAMRRGLTVEEISAKSGFDRWYLERVRALIDAERALEQDPTSLDDDPRTLIEYKRLGFSDARLATLTGQTELEIRALRWARGLHPTYKRVDTCAAEFEAHAHYFYSSYEGAEGTLHSEVDESCEARPSDRTKVMILGGGPNRIGQGIEFDYCCVHAAYALKEAGYEAIMVNCNPETVSTDYDTADRLYFEPLTAEDVIEIARVEAQRGTLLGVIVQLGGQTPLNLAAALEEAGIPILGTQREVIDRAEDRDRFQEMVSALQLKQPAHGIARDAEEASAIAERIGYPVLLRPSYVLGGRAMRLVYTPSELKTYMNEATEEIIKGGVLVDKYLTEAIEIDVDALCDGRSVYIVGVMEHIEEAGVHSGDSACALPPYSLSEDQIQEIERQTRILALELGVVGLMNIQFAFYEAQLYLIEVNPRASRTAPFVAKATNIPIAAIATRLMLGQTLERQTLNPRPAGYTAVKEAVFPFSRFPLSDVVLGPEMLSTGEVMGWDRSFPLAFAKAQCAAGMPLPQEGRLLFSIAQSDSRGRFAEIAETIASLGYEILATAETARSWHGQGIDCAVRTLDESTAVEQIQRGEIHGLISVSEAGETLSELRRAALAMGIPYFTRLSNARSLARAFLALHRRHRPSVRALQEELT